MTANPHNTMMDAAEMAFAWGSRETRDAIAAYLDAEAEKTPRARTRARTLRIAASNVRAGLWEKNDGR